MVFLLLSEFLKMAGVLYQEEGDTVSKSQEGSPVTQGALLGLIFYQAQQFCALIDVDQ